jgi:hypothetical protein
MFMGFLKALVVFLRTRFFPLESEGSTSMQRRAAFLSTRNEPSCGSVLHRGDKVEEVKAIRVWVVSHNLSTCTPISFITLLLIEPVIHTLHVSRSL